MSRIIAREKAFDLIFEYLFNNEKSEITLDIFLKDENLNDDDKEYMQKIYDGVIENYDTLVDYVASYSEGFRIERIFKTDLSILLLAIYELFYVKNIPVSVTCNEAVNLAKTFSAEKSPSFVNGILANIIVKEGIKK